MRTGCTIRWPSFPQYDSAYTEVLLGNELLGQAESGRHKELNVSSHNCVFHLITEEESAQVRLRAASSTLAKKLWQRWEAGTRPEVHPIKTQGIVTQPAAG